MARYVVRREYLRPNRWRVADAATGRTVAASFTSWKRAAILCDDMNSAHRRMLARAGIGGACR